MDRQKLLNLLKRGLCLALFFAAGACQSEQAWRQARPQAAAHIVVAGLHPLEPRYDLDAMVAPPIGWTAQAVKQNSRHIHETWISPSGNTAYGVIRLNLPWSVGPDLALWGFLKHMEQSEGQAVVLRKDWDRQLQGFRFVADGNLYEIRTELIVHNERAWAIYAGTLRDKPIDAKELELAEKARDYTEVGVPAGASSLAAGGAPKH